VDGIAISTERIATAAEGVSDVGALLNKEISAMRDLLAQISAGWQSDSAAPRFAATMQGYLEQATQLKDALLSHGASLLTTGHRFAEAESNLAEGMRRSH
jgi:WXG100 family type VII secretion target